MEKKKQVGEFAQQKAGVEDSKSNFQNIKQRKRAEIEGKVIKRESRERLVKGKRRAAEMKSYQQKVVHRCKRGRSNFVPKYCES